MRLPFTVIAVLLVSLVAVGFATDARPPEPRGMASVATIAERVEALRGLDFRRTPSAEYVTTEEATREGLADLDRRYPQAQRRADEALYARLGLLPEGTDLRELSASVFGEQVAGYYDPRTKRLRIVDGASGSSVTGEMIVAHELVHALEDQVFGLAPADLEGSDDPAYAYRALVEGTASAVMYAYLGEHFDAETSLAGLLAEGLNAPSTLDLPPFLVRQLLFAYVEGEQFVSALLRTAGSWQLVDVALRDRPPASTEQILHPRKWLEAEQPQRVALPSPGPAYERLTGGVFGEWQTQQLLALSGRPQLEAAEGWGGDRYALYRGSRGAVLIMRWVHDSARDGAEFAEALRAYVEDGLPARGEAAVAAGPGGVTLVIAPRARLARRLSRA